jgi:hypothetical protein
MQPVSAGDDLLGERQGVHATLVDAAARAVARHAMDGATVERIAEEAGLSRVTLHRRGVTRVELMLALVHRAARAYRDAPGPGSPPPTTPPGGCPTPCAPSARPPSTIWRCSPGCPPCPPRGSTTTRPGEEPPGSTTPSAGASAARPRPRRHLRPVGDPLWHRRGDVQPGGLDLRASALVPRLGSHGGDLRDRDARPGGGRSPPVRPR